MICAIACKSLSSSMPISLLFFTIIAVLRGLSMRVRCAVRIEIEKQSISRRNQLLFWYVGSLQAKTRQWHVFSQQSPFPRGRRLRRAIGKAQNKTPQDKSCGVLKKETYFNTKRTRLFFSLNCVGIVKRYLLLLKNAPAGCSNPCHSLG